MKRTSLVITAILLAGCTASETHAQTFQKPPVFDTSDVCGTDDISEITAKIAILQDLISKGPEANMEKDFPQIIMEKAALDLALGSASPELCSAAISKGEQNFRRTLSIQQSRMKRAGKYKKSRKKAIASTQASIAQLFRDSQATAKTAMALRTDDKTGADFWAYRLSVAHSAKVERVSRDGILAIVENARWIDRDRYGKPISDATWVITQQSGNYPKFQKRALTEMKPFLESGDINPANYAHLWDRVALNEDRKQRYGTQPSWECLEGVMQLEPIEENADLDELRKSVGLNPLAEGIAEMSRSLCK